MNECGKCLAMQIENWPRGATVARCFAEGNMFPPGRVINYSASGKEHFEHTKRPAWCSKNAQFKVHSSQLGKEDKDARQEV